MQHEIQASLKKFVESTLGVDCVWIYDGATLPSTRPIATIEALPNVVSTQSKGNETMERVYRFQIGVICANSTQKARLPEQLSDAINFGRIPLYDTTVSPAPIVGSFNAIVTQETPMPAGSVDETQKHKTYLDVTVTRLYGKN